MKFAVGSYATVLGPMWNRYNHVMGPFTQRGVRENFKDFGMGNAWKEYLQQVHKIIWRGVEKYWGRYVIVVGFKDIPYRWPEWMLDPTDKLTITWEV